MSDDNKRTTEFEVQSYSNKRWMTEGAYPTEGEATRFAKSLLSDDKVEEVKVLRLRSGAGIALEKEIFSQKREAKGDKRITISGRITEGRVCETVEQFMGLESRIIMNRVLRAFLDHLAITPTELMHNYGYIRKLDSLGLINAAVPMLAQAQSAAGHGETKVRVDAIYDLVNKVIAKAQETAAERKRIPVLLEGKFAQLCDRVDAAFPEEQRAYVIRTAITNYLTGGALSNKLEQIGALVTDDVNRAQAAHLDDVISDLLGAGSIVQNILGDQTSLGAALGLLADLVRDKLDITAVRSPTAQLKLVYKLISGRGMASSKAVLFERLQREYFSSKPLVRTNDPSVERQVFNAFVAKITDEKGTHLFGPAFEAQSKQRSDAIRRNQLKSLGIAT